MTITGSDPLALLARLSGAVGAPLAEGAASGSSALDATQRAITIGEVAPIVFCRRVGNVGGVLVSPGATEARFENDAVNAVTARYHLVVCDGEIDRLQVRDVFQQSCRVGSHSQSYNRRAGSWTPGNFIVARAGYTVPECPYYCGSGGSYAGLSTLDFRCTYPDGDSTWDRQVHAFVRGGLHVTRLLDAVTGPSNNYADLVHWSLQNCSRVPAALIDSEALEAAALFTNTNGLLCNIKIEASTNLEEFIQQTAPMFLLAQSRRQGRKGLRPLLPVVPETGAIDTGVISPRWLFDSRSIVPGSFAITYTPLADRQPFCALMLWRQQPTDDFGLIRTTEVRYTDLAPDGPFEQYDLSAFCCSENHAVKVGAYLIARRRYVEHTLTLSVVPGAWSAQIAAGDIVRVRLRRQATSSAASLHDFFYEVNRIGRSLAGDLRLELTHFPVDEEGRSIVAREVAAATGGGILLPTGRTGVSCDLNDPMDDSELPDEGLDGGEPDPDEVGVEYPPLIPSPPPTDPIGPDGPTDPELFEPAPPLTGGNAPTPAEQEDEEEEDEPEPMRVRFGEPEVTAGLVRVRMYLENMPTGLVPPAPGFVDPAWLIILTLSNNYGSTPTFTSDSYDPISSTSISVVVQFPADSGEQTISISSIALTNLPAYGESDFDLTATFEYDGGDPPSLTRALVSGTVGAGDEVYEWTIAAPGISESWTTPLPTGTPDGMSTTGAGYIAWDPLSGEVTYIAAIRVSQSFNIASSRYYQHFIVAGGTVSSFQLAVETAYDGHPPNGLVFLSGVGLDAYDFTVDGASIEAAPGYLGSISTS